MGSSFLQGTCLKPSYSLRRQLLLSFGSTALLTLAIVVTVACICSRIAGNTVKEPSIELLEEQVVARLANNSRYVAETFTAYMSNMESTVQLMSALVEDRIMGYPNLGWEEDRHVPFLDMDSGAREYPLKSSPLPMDWAINNNVNLENAVEHVQERKKWVAYFPPISTASGSYFMQGVCDPEAMHPSSITHHGNCTVASNDPDTGGTVQPTATNKGLYEKAADIAVLLKPLFEMDPEILVAGIYFHNSGAGSQVQFPGNTRDGRISPYTSKGCDWMR
jgi:hypothetical protein